MVASRSVVQLNVTGRDLIGFVEEAKAKVSENLSLPKGYSIIWAGTYENQVRSNQRLLLLIPLALLINILIIYFGFRKLSSSIIVFSAVPVATAGGLLLVWWFQFSTVDHPILRL